MSLRHSVIKAGFGLLGATRVHEVVAPLTRGLGAILMLHHVRPERDERFAPNKLLAVTPGYLDQLIRRLRQRGYAIVSLDDALRRLAAPTDVSGPFAVLTFDDGFRDAVQYALPVLEQHDAPGTFYITTGFADRTARLWWMELEEAVRRADRVTVTIDGERLDLDATTPEAKSAAFLTLYWRLRAGPEERLLAVIGELCRAQGIESSALADVHCLDWDGIAGLARHPLVTIGAHTITHPMLAKHDEAVARAEIAGSGTLLEKHLGCPVRHFAYPVGDPTAAGPRDFRLAAEAGYASAVTTRPGLLFPAHARRLFALPRVSINGNHQTVLELDVLLSGLAFLLWNKGRRVAPI